MTYVKEPHSEFEGCVAIWVDCIGPNCPSPLNLVPTNRTAGTAIVTMQACIPVGGVSQRLGAAVAMTQCRPRAVWQMPHSGSGQSPGGQFLGLASQPNQ